MYIYMYMFIYIHIYLYIYIYGSIGFRDSSPKMESRICKKWKMKWTLRLIVVYSSEGFANQGPFSPPVTPVSKTRNREP